MVPFVPIVVASLSFPIAERAPRSAIVTAGLLAWLTSLTTVAFAFNRQLDLGGFARVAQVGFQGVRLTVSADTPVPLRLDGTPLSLIFALVVGLSGLAILVASVRARGGGARREHRPSTSAAFLAQVLTLGLVQWAILSPSLAATATALVITSLLGAALLLSERPRARELDGALKLFALHRVGDACAVVALILTYAAVPDAERYISWLWLGAAASRLSPIGVPAFFRDATGAPGPTIATFHGVAGFGLAGWICVVTSARWDPTTWRVVAVLAGVTALYAAARAALTDHAIRADLHLLQAIAALAVLGLALGSFESGVLGLLLTVAFAPALLLPTVAVIEALHGRTSLFDFGGLWKPLRATDFARGVLSVTLLAAPISPLYLLGERVAFEALSGPRHSALLTALTVGALFTIGFAAFRAFHLTFSGEQPRSPSPALLLDVGWPRRATQTILAFALILAPPLFAAQPFLVGLIGENYREPFLFLLQPHLVDLSPYPVAVSGTPVSPDRLSVEPLARYQLSVGLAILAIVGYGLSRALYRNRAGDPARPSGWLGTAFDVVEGGLGLEGRLVRGAVAFALIIAVAVRTLVFNFFLDGVITRVTGGLFTLVRAGSRVVHNGDAQRALAVTILVLAVVLFLWGQP
jgi:hypothetical protein